MGLCPSLQNGTHASTDGEKGRPRASNTSEGPFECREGSAIRPLAKVIIAHVVSQISLFIIGSLWLLYDHNF